MVVTGSPQKVGSRIFWKRLGADVKGFERQIVFLSQRSRARKIAPGLTIVWVYLQDLRELGYGIVIALTRHMQVAEPRVRRGVLRIGSNLPAQYIFRLI